MKKYLLLFLFFSLPVQSMPLVLNRAKQRITRAINHATDKVIETTKEVVNNEDFRAACVVVVTFALAFYGFNKFFSDTTPLVQLPHITKRSTLEFTFISANNNAPPLTVPVRELWVTPQVGSTCGYHQVKNFFTVLMWELTGHWSELDTDFHFGPDGTWRKLLVEQFDARHKDCNTYLNSDEINYLLNHITPNNFVGDRAGYSVIDNIDHLGNQNVDLVTPRLLDNLNNAASYTQPYCHGLIINTAHERVDSSGHSRADDAHGHWFGIFINQDGNGNRAYSVMDSLNSNPHSACRLDDPRVSQVITHIERSFAQGAYRSH